MAKATVLIIEDDPLVIKALKEKFATEDLAVLEAGDGKQGLDLAFNNHPDIILLDLVMSVMDGLTMLRELRADTWGSQVPVIILTNLKDSEEIAAASKAGVNSYLIKSDWRLGDVVAKIKSYLTLK